MQQLWLQHVDWDEPLPEEVAVSFREYLVDLDRLKAFSVPRPIRSTGQNNQLVVFCDASRKAYCGVVYMRSLNARGKIDCKMICAKLRVAPVRAKSETADSIAKLELYGAVLAAELVMRVAGVLKIPSTDIHAFTDNTTILCWLSKSPENWKTAVRNRVQKIQKIVPYNRWRFTPTAENPADLATRGASSIELFDKKEFWLNGPEFVKLENWLNIHEIPNFDVQNALEKRRIKCSAFVTTNFRDFCEDFSSLPKLIRVVAYILRFVRKKPVVSKVIDTNEYNEAFRVIVVLQQQLFFPNDVARLKEGRPVKKKSSLRSLNPILEEDGLLRIGGRLQNSNYSNEKKHPVILSAKSHVTKLLIRHIHEKYFHAVRL